MAASSERHQLRPGLRKRSTVEEAETGLEDESNHINGTACESPGSHRVAGHLTPLPFLDFDVPVPTEFPEVNVSAVPQDTSAEDLSTWLASQLGGQEDDIDLPQTSHLASELSSEMLTMLGTGPLLATGTTGPCGSTLPPFVRPPLSDVPLMSEEAKFATISLKLFGCTPAELPNDLKSQLQSWFLDQASSMEGYLRPGCVHLTVQAILSGNGAQKPSNDRCAQRTEAGCCSARKRVEPGGGFTTWAEAPVGTWGFGGMKAFVEKMVSSGEAVWCSRTLLIQLAGEIGIVWDGELRHTWDAESAPGGRALPCVAKTSPLFLSAGSSAQLKIQGVNLLQDDCEVVCRSQGDYVPVERARCTQCSCSAAVTSRCATGTCAETSSEGWEKQCCGCCTSKIAQLSLQSASDDANETGRVQGSCCSSRQRPRAQVLAADMQSVEIRLVAPKRSGILYVDVMCEPFMSLQGGRTLVVDDPEAFAELAALEIKDRRAAEAWSTVLSIVYEWAGDRDKIEYSVVERKAAKLIHVALSAGLIAVARHLHCLLLAHVMASKVTVRLLRHLSESSDGPTLLTQVDKVCKGATLRRVMALGCDDGCTLLHQAVKSQRPDALNMVLEWGSDAGQPWRCDVAGPGGLSPLHLATLAEDPIIASRLVFSLVSTLDSGMHAWRSALAEDGKTPADYAVALGRYGLVDTFGASLKKKESNVAPVALAKIQPLPIVSSAPSTPRRCMCIGDCPCAKSAEPCASCTASSSDEDDSVCCGSKNGVCGCCSKDHAEPEHVTK